MSDDHKKHYDGAPSEGPMNIDVSMVRELAEMLDDTGLTDIEVEDGPRRIRVSRKVHAAPVAAPAPAAAAPAPAPTGGRPASSEGSEPGRTPALASTSAIGWVMAPSASSRIRAYSARVRDSSRCFGPLASAVMNGRLILT